MIAKEAIHGVTITLEVGDATLLYIFLDDQGNVQRLGNGEADFTDRDMYTGTSSQQLFESLLGVVDDDMLAEAGSYDLPDRAGTPCRLLILFSAEDERTTGFEFLYGTESEGPPVEIADFVIRALDLTEPWYNDQQPDEKRRK